MNDTIKNFVPFRQEFNPSELYTIIDSFNESQLVKLNEYLLGTGTEEMYQGQLKFYPFEYLTQLCYEEDSSDFPTFLDINYDDIWEERFKFTDLVKRIEDIKNCGGF